MSNNIHSPNLRQDKIAVLKWPAQDILSAVCYAFLTAILTYPVLFHLAGEIAGFKGEDNLQWRWFLWWFKHSLLALQTSVTDVSILYAPLGGEQPLYAVVASRCRPA